MSRRATTELVVVVAPQEVGLGHRLAVVVRELRRAVLIRLHAPPPLDAQVGVTRVPAAAHLAEVVWFGPFLSAVEVDHLIGWLRDGGHPGTMPDVLCHKVVRRPDDQRPGAGAGGTCSG